MADNLIGYISSKQTLQGELSPKNVLTGTLSLSLNGGGTTNYNNLKNIPTIEGIQVKGDKFFTDYGLKAISNLEIETLLN